MSVDRAEVDRLARLARLALEDDEADRLTDEMNRILEHVERLRSADAQGAASADPSVHPSGLEVGSDDARTQLGDPDALAGSPSMFAPDWAQGFFVVPLPPGVKADDDA